MGPSRQAWSGARVLVAALIGCAAVAGCVSDADSGAGSSTTSGAPSSAAASTTSSAPTSTSVTSTPAASTVLFLVGQQGAVGAAVGLLGGFETRVNGTPGRNDVVLFTVSAEDGPMPQTRERIEALRGKSYGPSAILLVRTDKVPDLELRALVVQETRDLLTTNQAPGAADLPVLLAEDPNIALLIRGLTR